MFGLHLKVILDILLTRNVCTFFFFGLYRLQSFEAYARSREHSHMAIMGHPVVRRRRPLPALFTRVSL
jgi:hypothetical protein